MRWVSVAVLDDHLGETVGGTRVGSGRRGVAAGLGVYCQTLVLRREGVPEKRDLGSLGRGRRDCRA